MPIANPLQNPQISGQIADLFGQIGAVKLWKSIAFNSNGVNVTLLANETETHETDKRSAVEKALTKVAAKGITLPNAIKVYCVGSTQCGTLQMKNVAFQRGIGGQREASIVLSPKVLDANWAGTLGGMCTKAGVYDGTPVGLATAIVVHEIGHLLHEIADEDSFWGPMPPFPNGLRVDEIYRDVSLYATTNSKELVAEVFLGRTYSVAFPGSIMDAYRALSGPAANLL